jgi:opacity protein-like surface antigen
MCVSTAVISRRCWAIAAALVFAGAASLAQAADTVKLIVDYGDGVEKHFTALTHKKDMTVLDAVRAAEKHAHGIKTEIRSSGETAFLMKIDDVANEGSGKNWVFRVNGKLGDRSLGIQKLRPGDTVLWRFQEYE